MVPRLTSPAQSTDSAERPMKAVAGKASTRGISTSLAPLSDVRERERRSGKNGIERQQQERLPAPDLHRNAEQDRDESRHRNNRGIPDEEDGQGGQRERDCAHGGQPGR